MSNCICELRVALILLDLRSASMLKLFLSSVFCIYIIQAKTHVNKVKDGKGKVYLIETEPGMYPYIWYGIK